MEGEARSEYERAFFFFFSFRPVSWFVIYLSVLNCFEF